MNTNCCTLKSEVDLFLIGMTKGSYGDECQACSSRVLQLSNSVEIFSRVASEREQEATSENKIFRPIIVWSEMLR